VIKVEPPNPTNHNLVNTTNFRGCVKSANPTHGAVGGWFRSDLQNARPPVPVFVFFLANARKRAEENNNGRASVLSE
jgi:hypothetical protein